MSTRAFNFSAGPAVLPEPVLRQAQQDLIDLFGSGIGICEHSHRGKEFDRVIDEANADCREIAGIPDSYHILYLQGGASTQFFNIPMCFLGAGRTADYLNTGAWSKKAIKEAKRFGNVNVVATSEDKNFNYIPSPDTFKFTPGAAYCHFTSNNTIFGTQFQTEPVPPAGVPLVCDASSDIFCRRIDVSRYGMIYAGAQKNLGPSGCALIIMSDDMLNRASADVPVMLDYHTHAKEGSRYNTPNTFAIYLMGQVFKWIKSCGGLAAIEKINREKAGMLYDYLESTDFYRTTAEPDSQSLMNVCFRCTNEDLESRFIAEASERNLRNLKGHRSVGGMRASIYNAFPVEGVRALVEFMKDFETRNR